MKISRIIEKMEKKASSGVHFNVATIDALSVLNLYHPPLYREIRHSMVNKHYKEKYYILLHFLKQISEEETTVVTWDE